MAGYSRQQLDNVRIARRAAKAAGIDPNRFERQMRQEARFGDPTSPAGAQGPAQIMPATAADWGVKNVHDPHEAYTSAANHMAGYLRQYGGDWSKALTAYNAGPGRVGGPLPAETRNYIKTVLGSGSSVKTATPQKSVVSAGSGNTVKLEPGRTTVDTKGAVLAALLDPRKKMSLASRIVGNVSSGDYTTTTKPKVTTTKGYGVAAAAKKPAASPAATSGLHGSKILELIHNDGGKGYGIKNGQVVDGASVYSSVWAGHANHVHVAAGPKTIVELGKLAQHMGLHVSENSHFGGVTQGAHVADSYHYKDEAIDVSGDAAKMNAYARAVAAYNHSHG